MIITINQAQIEEAITDFVHSRLVVQEGMRLDIDLKATRGDSGMTAVIEITPANKTPAFTPAAEVPVAVEEVPEAAPAPVAKATPFKRAAKTTSATPAPEAAEPEAAPADEADESESPAAEETAPKRASIFANMKKPTGRVGDGDNAEAA